MKTTNIYFLEDPDIKIPRYVGKTNHPNKRVKGHISEAKHGKNTHKNNWITSILKQGNRPVLQIIDEVSIDEWEFWEIWWYQYLKSFGFELVNDEKELGTGVTILTSEQRNNSGTQRSGKIIKCEKCGKEKYYEPSKLKTERKYCSHKCGHRVVRKKLIKIGKIINCKHCGKEKYYKPYDLKNGNGKYCSRKCANRRYV